MAKTLNHTVMVACSTALFFLQSCLLFQNPLIPPSAFATGDWVRMSQLNGQPRSEAVSFVIGDTAYLCTGYGNGGRMADTWAYSRVINSWWQQANFPGAARSAAVAFAFQSSACVGTGYDGTNMLNDFYRFNQATNTWDTIPPLPGTARYDAVAFTLNNCGYVATGFDGTYQNDCWQYNPGAGAKGAWTKKANVGGTGRAAAVAFVHNAKAYIVTGINNGYECGDFWSYNPEADTWGQLRNIYDANNAQTYDDNYTGIRRHNAAAFVIGDTAFLTTGQNIGLLQSTWAYSFTQGQWVPRSAFQGSARQGAVAFALNGLGYVSTGQSSTEFFDDLVRFNPNQPLNAEDF